MTNKLARVIVHHDSCHIIQPLVVKALGRSAALFLQQLHYWLTSSTDVGKIHDGQRWIFNSFKDWAEHIQTLSESTVKRVVTKLRKMGIIETRNLNNHKAVHTNWYTIHYAKLQSLLETIAVKKEDQKDDLLQVKMIQPLDQNDPIIPEITSNILISNKSSLVEEKSFQAEILEESHLTQHVDQEVNLKTKDSTAKATITQDMLQIWNESVGEGGQKASMTKDRARYLMAAFKFKFQSKLDLFKAYCHKIASSDFLMGRVKETFKATLDWVLKFSTIQRIQEGQYGVKDDPVPMMEALDETKAQNSIKKQGYTSMVESFHMGLLKGLGVVRYQSWKDSIKDIRMGDGYLIFITQTAFARDWMANHLKTDMERSLGQRIEMVMG